MDHLFLLVVEQWEAQHLELAITLVPILLMIKMFILWEVMLHQPVVVLVVVLVQG